MESNIWHWLGIGGAIIYVSLLVLMRVASHWFNSDNTTRARIGGFILVYLGAGPNAPFIYDEMRRRNLR